MKRSVLWPMALCVLGVAPLAPVLLAGVNPPVQCCYGSTCPTYPGCTIVHGDPGPPTCKRLCTASCTEGNKCCQYQTRVCTYTGEDCPPSTTENINATVYEYKYCPTSQAQVECLHTAISACGD